MTVILASDIMSLGGWSVAVEQIRRRGSEAVSRRGFLAGLSGSLVIGQRNASSAPDPNAMPPHHGVYEVESYNYTGRTRVHPDTAKTGNYHAFITWGQSQGTNVGTTPHTVVNTTTLFNVSLQNGAIYQAQDPLLSIPGTGGSIWAKLGDALITNAVYDRVILLPLNIGSTGIADWRNNGVVNYRIRAGVSRLFALGIPVNRITILAMIGESDAAAGTSQATMQAGYTEVRSIFDGFGLTSPMWVPKETWVLGASNATIRAAQTAVANGTTIKAGPDFDTLDNTNRSGGQTDFNDPGVAAAAVLWRTALTA
jgi:hypothetical protein